MKLKLGKLFEFEITSINNDTNKHKKDIIELLERGAYITYSSESLKFHINTNNLKDNEQYLHISDLDSCDIEFKYQNEKKVYNITDDFNDVKISITEL